MLKLVKTNRLLEDLLAVASRTTTAKVVGGVSKRLVDEHIFWMTVRKIQ
jgi:hypothetical protein